MSIFQRFKGLTGPLAALAAQREEVANQEHCGSSEKPRFRCRLCEHEDLQKDYCPKCLAQTMEPISQED